MNHITDASGRRRRPLGVGLSIVLATLVGALVLPVFACSGRRPVDPAVRSTVDTYLEGFKSEDATKVLGTAAVELRQSMPRLPEEVARQLRATNERYGGVERWTVQDEQVDTLNGQALVTVRVTSKKVIHIVLLDLRKEEGEWRIYGIKDQDAVRNPAYDQQIPSDIGRDNPFEIR